MLDTVSVPLQAVFLPLAGAAIILALNRLLPNWIRRLLALGVTLLSLVVLWSMRSGVVERVEVLWLPLSFFRTSPTLYPDSLSLLGGLTLTGLTAAVVLGIRGFDPQRTAWHGLILIALAGCLVTMMAANLLTLALGSALIDLALIVMAVAATANTDRGAWPALSMAVPGIASTLVLLLSALQMDTQVHTTSLLARDLPTSVLTLVSVAGMLRLLIFPLHPKRLDTPEDAATLLLPVGTGIYLLARSQALAPAPVHQPWMLVIGAAALLFGGFRAWTGGTWPAVAVHQTGYALVYAVLLAGSVPWPLFGLALALGTMAVGWDSTLERMDTPWPRGVEWIVQRIRPWWAKVRSQAAIRLPALARWPETWVGERGTALRLSSPWLRSGQAGRALLPAVAMASLAGAPLTVGALGRWPLYATLLHQSESSLLIAIVVADSFLAAGLWTALIRSITQRQTGEHQPKPAALLAMLALVVLVIAVGIRPSNLTGALGLKPVSPPQVSVWGLGLIYVLPWLLGGWLARVGPRLVSYLPVDHNLGQRIANLSWLYRTVAWAGQRLMGLVYWLGQVGEGEGWWGWALIILILGALFLTIR